MSGTNDMRPPVDPWIMETGSIYLWSLLLLATILLTLKNRKMPLFGLMLLAGSSGFWQEFFADWGAYVAWNPAFARLPFWGEMAYTTPVKPLFMPFSWGWWFAVSIPLLTSLTIWLKRKFTARSVYLLAMVIAFPLFLVYQIYVEGSSVANAWWTYDSVIGPALESENGRLPLIFPLLIGIWAGWFVGMLADRDESGFMAHEIRLGILAKPTGWGREWTRLWSMALLFQVTFLMINVIPAMIGRALFGGPSLLVP
ncbi:hypothetical protein [Parasphingorhabdus sp.]|uniref:hypothetical protein n=1 Tax=Parasphingorhabdus sp. TaxID=2709688 RepID=UPI003BB213E5